MIGLYKDDGTRLSITVGSLVLNNPSDAGTGTYEVNFITTVPQYDATIDSDNNKDGAIIGPARRIFYVVRLDGIIRATSLAALFDKKKALIAATDPALLTINNPSTFGVINVDFSVPTADTANYATGLVASRYKARPRAAAIPQDSVYHGFASPYSLELAVVDPRRYFQTQQTKTISGTGTTAAGNTLADYPSWPTVTITASGAGNAAYSVGLASDGLDPLVLDLSGLVDTDVVVVDMEKQTITKNGTDAPDLFVSGEFFPIGVTNANLEVANGTNMSTQVAWYRAFVA